MRNERWALGCLAATACAHAPATPTPPPPVEEVIARAHQDVAERMQKGGWPGLAVGVVIDEKLVYTEGFGRHDPTTKEPVTAHTLFRLASLTKLFTGLAILQLRDTGRLDLDDPVSQYLPEIDRVVYPTSEHPPIRIRHLVTHTSGLPHDGKREPGMSEADLLQELDGLPLEFTPGSDSGYSNLAMALAGLVVERVAGMSYRDYMYRLVLEPLGMTESTWEVSAASQPVAVGMTWDAKQKAYRPIATDLIEGAMEPAGGLYSNIADMARFAAFEMSAWPARAADETPPLSRASLRESQLTAGPVVPVGGLPGVNWFVRNNADFGQLNVHSGKLDGYRSEIVLLPRRHVGVIVLASGDADLDELAYNVLKAFAPLKEEPSKPVGPELRAATERLIAWLQTADPKTAPTVFSTSTLEEDTHLFSDTAKARADYGGNCRFDGYLTAGSTQARVQLKCERGTWPFTVVIQPKPPSLIQGWWW
jgi:CubicO group peptidase (beta-lactamase class C family)